MLINGDVFRVLHWRKARDNVVSRCVHIGAEKLPVVITTAVVNFYLRRNAGAATDGYDFFADARGGDNPTAKSCIPSCSNHNQTGIPRIINGFNQRHVDIPVICPNGEIDDAYVIFGAIFHYPINTGQCLGRVALSVLIQDFNGNNVAARSNPTVAPLRLKAASGCDTGNVRYCLIILTEVL